MVKGDEREYKDCFFVLVSNANLHDNSQDTALLDTIFAASVNARIYAIFSSPVLPGHSTRPRKNRDNKALNYCLKAHTHRVNMSNATETAEEALLLQMQQAKCYPYTEGIPSVYKYYPSFVAGIIFCVLFGIPFFYHTFQSIRFRAATSIVLAFGALSMLSLFSIFSPQLPFIHNIYRLFKHEN